ncbi:MAG: twin-arginine translocase TatA/TatE family subunit [Bacteroidetes bacterium]|nr:twin-arginine translocase TatA/TatE family subunit [Bacteroidota bacterium]
MTLLFKLLLLEDVSTGELLLVLLGVFLLFGPSKIPEIAKGLAKGINDLKKATQDIRDEVSENIDPIKKEIQNSVDTLKNSLNSDEIDPQKQNLKPEDKKKDFSG